MAATNVKVGNIFLLFSLTSKSLHVVTNIFVIIMFIFVIIMFIFSHTKKKVISS